MSEKLDDLQSRFTDLKEFYADMYGEMLKAHEYYEGKFEMTAPENTTLYRLPTAREEIEVAARELITDEPKVRRRREGHQASWKADDDKVELAIQNFLLNLELYFETPVLADAAKLLMKRGQVILAGPFFSESDKQVWVEPYDPLTVCLEPGMNPREGFVYLEMTVAEMEQQAKRVKKLSGFDRKERKGKDLITLVQWWRYVYGEKMGEYAAWIDRDHEFLAEPGPSGYPYLPLESIWSGWGQATIGTAPRERAVSLLNRQHRDALRAESELFTLTQDEASKGVHGHYYLEDDQQLPEGFQIKWEPGSITPDVPKGGLHEFPKGGLPDSVRDQWAMLQGILHQSGVQPLLSGQRQPGVTTATGYQILSGQARRKFYPPVRMLAGGVSRISRKLCRLADLLGATFPEAFTWHGAKLTKDLLHEDYNVVVELLAEDIEERRMLRAQGLTLKEELPQGIRFEKFYGIENVHQAQVDLMVDKLMNSELVLNELARRVGIVAQEGEAGAIGAPTGGNPMEQVAAIMGASRRGFVPPQPGTVEGQGQIEAALRAGARGG